MSSATQNSNLLAPNGQTFTLPPDGVYPFNDPVDKYVVIIGGEEVAWASTHAQAQRSYTELLRVEKEHVTANPDNAQVWLEAKVEKYQADVIKLEAELKHAQILLRGHQIWLAELEKGQVATR